MFSILIHSMKYFYVRFLLPVKRYNLPVTWWAKIFVSYQLLISVTACNFFFLIQCSSGVSKLRLKEQADITALPLHLLCVLWKLTEIFFILISQAVLLSERGKKASKNLGKWTLPWFHSGEKESNNLISERSKWNLIPIWFILFYLL